VTELAIKVASEPTPAIRSLRPDVPEDLVAIIFKCLEKDRSRPESWQHCATCGEMAIAPLGGAG
jgi:hypothetical protein